MKNETYLMINGQKIELTDEQKKQLGIIEEIEEKSCFDRAEWYYFINCYGEVEECPDMEDYIDNHNYAVANYCTDEELMNQRALHETLNRLLFKYSMTHDGDKIDWNSATMPKWLIYWSHTMSNFYVVDGSSWKADGVVYFYTNDIALKAIEEIVKPFIKEHPDFVW